MNWPGGLLDVTVGLLTSWVVVRDHHVAAPNAYQFSGKGKREPVGR